MTRRIVPIALITFALMGCENESHVIGAIDSGIDGPVEPGNSDDDGGYAETDARTVVCNTLCYRDDNPCLVGYWRCEEPAEPTCTEFFPAALGTPCGDNLVCDGNGACGPRPIDRRKLDLLFVVDNSGSMAQEQAALVLSLPRTIKSLVTGDRFLNDGPAPETRTDNFDPFPDIHVGVITTDLGTAGVAVNTCFIQPDGENGLLRNRAGGGAPSGCESETPAIMSFHANEDGYDMTTHASADVFAAQTACVAQVGIDGCGFEQQLEAALKAVTPAWSSIRFFNDRLGSGTGTRNEGFIREDSIVLVVVVTDEDDCSFQDAAIVDGSRTDVRLTNINLRCAYFPELLYPVERYVTGLRALRPGREGSVYFGAIAGIPTDLLGDPNAPINYDVILNDPRMVLQADPENPNQLRAACNDPDRGRADPARRIVETAKLFGDNGFLLSICQADYAEIAGRIANTLR